MEGTMGAWVGVQCLPAFLPSPPSSSSFSSSSSSSHLGQLLPDEHAHVVVRAALADAEPRGVVPLDAHRAGRLREGHELGEAVAGAAPAVGRAPAARRPPAPLLVLVLVVGVLGEVRGGVPELAALVCGRRRGVGAVGWWWCLGCGGGEGGMSESPARRQDGGDGASVRPT